MCGIFSAAARCDASSRRLWSRSAHLFERGLPPNNADVLGDATEEDNQILRSDSELWRLRLTDRASAGCRLRSKRFKICFERILCHGLGFEGRHCAHVLRCKRRRGRDIVMNVEEASVRRDRLQQICGGSLRTAPYQALGGADRGRAGVNAKVGLARRLPMIMHRRCAERAPSTLQNLRGENMSGPGATSGLLETKCLRDDGSG